RALVTLARNQGARQTMEQLWVYGLRNLGAGGHAAILVANCFRALETIGWQEAEQALRFVVQDLYLLSAEKPDLYWASNTARADRHQGKLAPTGRAGLRPGSCWGWCEKGKPSRRATWPSNSCSAASAGKPSGTPSTWRPRN